MNITTFLAADVALNTFLAVLLCSYFVEYGTYVLECGRVLSLSCFQIRAAKMSFPNFKLS